MKGIFDSAKEALTKMRRFTTPFALRRRLMHRKSLAETLLMYPNNGVDFKVWRIDWPAHRYCVVTHVDTANGRYPKVFGRHFVNGESEPAPREITHSEHRGLWNHEVGVGQWKLQNGLVYTDVELREFQGKMFPKKKLYE